MCSSPSQPASAATSAPSSTSQSSGRRSLQRTSRWPRTWRPRGSRCRPWSRTTADRYMGMGLDALVATHCRTLELKPATAGMEWQARAAASSGEHESRSGDADHATDQPSGCPVTPLFPLAEGLCEARDPASRLWWGCRLGQMQRHARALMLRQHHRRARLPDCACSPAWLQSACLMVPLSEQSACAGSCHTTSCSACLSRCVRVCVYMCCALPAV